LVVDLDRLLFDNSSLERNFGATTHEDRSSELSNNSGTYYSCYSATNARGPYSPLTSHHVARRSRLNSPDIISAFESKYTVHSRNTDFLQRLISLLSISNPA
jgi:hypothetical protein